MSEAFDLHWDRAFEFYEEGKLVEAIAEWREASRLDPEDGYVLNNIGKALWHSGQQEAAIAEWREAVRLEPDYGNPHGSLARALSNLGYSPEALAAVRAAIHLCPDDASLYLWLGYHLTVEANNIGRNGGKDDYEAAAAAFQQAIDLDPSISDALRNLGLIQWRLGQKREAIKTLKAAIAVDPNDADAHIALWEFQGRAIWRCRGRREHFRGLVETVTAINNLPESEALNQHFEWINRIWLRIYITSSIGVGVGVTALLLRRWWRKQR